MRSKHENIVTFSWQHNLRKEERVQVNQGINEIMTFHNVNNLKHK